jgi:hypothetical protein
MLSTGGEVMKVFLEKIHSTGLSHLSYIIGLGAPLLDRKHAAASLSGYELDFAKFNHKKIKKR